MTWFIFALLSTFFFIFYSLLARILSIKSSNPRAFSFVYNLICSLIVLIIFIFEKSSFSPINLRIILYTLAAVTFWGLFNRTEFFAHKYMETSLRTIVSKTSELVTFVTAILLLGEAVTAQKIIAAFIILSASVLALYKNNKQINKKGLLYTLLTSLFLGLAWTLDKKASAYYPTSFYVFLGYFLSSFYVVPFPTLSFKEIKKEFQLANWKVVLLACLNVLGYYSLVQAFKLGEASNVILILASRSAFTVLAGIFVLKETSNIFRKIIGAVAVTIGILLLK
jgi:drug/metabolite transporter (DMT)-like permease